MHSRDHSWLHGDEHMTEIDELHQQHDKSRREDFFMLVDDLLINIKYLRNDPDFVPDGNDEEMLADLCDQLAQNVDRLV